MNVTRIVMTLICTFFCGFVFLFLGIATSENPEQVSAGRWVAIGSATFLVMIIVWSGWGFVDMRCNHLMHYSAEERTRYNYSAGERIQLIAGLEKEPWGYRAMRDAHLSSRETPPHPDAERN